MAKEAGYEFVDDILKLGFEVVHLNSELTKEYEQKNSKLRNIICCQTML